MTRLTHFGIAAILAVAGLCGATEKGQALRFDMGGAKTPLAEGCTRVTPEQKYSSQSGFGWESPGGEAFDVDPPTPADFANMGPPGQVIPEAMILQKELNDGTRDGVISQEDLIFRADAPNGVYRVAITLGHLKKPLGSMQVYINDELAGKDIDAKHFVRRAYPALMYGFPRTLRRTVTVKDGTIRIKIHGDESGFLARFAGETKRPIPFNYLLNEEMDPALFNKETKLDPKKWDSGEVWVWQDIGAPFRGNAIMGVEIYPFMEQPLFLKGGKLAAASSDAPVQKAVELFNSGKLAEAEKAFDAVKANYTKALGWLWIAGRPDSDEEQRLVPKAYDTLKEVATQRNGDLRIAEALEHARRFDKAIWRFYHRADDQRTYSHLQMIYGELASMEPDEPGYLKTSLYAARGMYMVNPSRHTYVTGVGRQLLERVETAGYGTNRYAQWYLHGKWNGLSPDWTVPDYSPKTKGAPAWAANVYEAYNRFLDLTEWWIKTRQAPDGSLGGGWGDDVEVLRSFGSYGAICPDASPLALDGVRKVANGAWNSGSIDTKSGFFAEVGDTEHSGEFTADTLGAMIRIDYGNPLYLEHAMMTGKLMRDLWMGRNENGQLWIKSNLLGATGIGSPVTWNDSRINCRPAQPARAVLWYNGSPALRKMFLDWADSWLAAAMSTEKGKPKGIIPQEIGFAGGEIGGLNAPAWYRADHPSGTVNYDWSGLDYHDYIVDLLLFAHRTTGDAKYLEPMNLEAQYVLEHGPKEVMDSEIVKKGDTMPDLWKKYGAGSPEWIATRMAPWPAKWDEIQRIEFPGKYPDAKDMLTLAGAAKQARADADMAMQRWPNVTTECIATDRVYWPGMGAAMRAMTAFGIPGADMPVSYRGLGREFAAAVMRIDSASLRLALYNMDDKAREAAVVPWLLEVGPTYKMEAGPDEDGDGRMDSPAIVGEKKVSHRGEEFKLTLPPRKAYVVEIDKVAGKTAATLMADLAVTGGDIVFRPEFRRVEVTVHNIGSEAAKGVVVALYEGEKEIGRERIPNLAAPLDFSPQVARVGFAYTPGKEKAAFSVVIDPDSAIQEITRINNRATAEEATPTEARKKHWDS